MMKNLVLLLSATALLSACGWMGEKEKTPLKGTREPVLQAQTADALKLESGATPMDITLPDIMPNTVWSQAMGYPSHNPVHLQLDGGLSKRLWSGSVGKGASKESPLMASPVIVGQTVFSLDTRGRVMAFSLDKGKTVWKSETRAKKQDKDELSAGGGIAYGRNQLVITNGSRDIIALNAENGNQLWRKSLDAPLRGAPSVIGGRAYVTDAVNHIVAIDTTNGAKLWSFDGMAQPIALLGTPAPAIDNDKAIAALSSGTVTAVGLTDGQSLWNGRFNLSRMSDDSLTNLRDVAGVPVIDNGRVMAVNATGYMLALDPSSGQRLWQKDVEGTGTIWAAGDVGYVMTRYGLSARNLTSGDPVWNVNLPQFEDAKDKENPITWYGPYLLSGKLYAFGSAGKAVVFDPVKGTQIAVVDIADDLAAPPSIASNIIVMVGHDGQISAWQ